MFKECGNCGESKTMNSFTKDSSKPDKKRNYCKDCERITGKARYKKTKEHMFAYRHSLMGRMSSYKCQAKNRGYSFDLTKEEFESFWQQPCNYCGGSIATIGIDRVDNTIGYTLDNCVSCCSRCNRMKLEISEEEWYDHMLNILRYKGVI